MKLRSAICLPRVLPHVAKNSAAVVLKVRLLRIVAKFFASSRDVDKGHVDDFGWPFSIACLLKSCFACIRPLNKSLSENWQPLQLSIQDVGQDIE